MKDKIISALITIIFTILIFFIGTKSNTLGDPTEAYQVYLNGTKIGLIQSKDKLLSMIDDEQEEIKKEYGVDKVYPPDGLSVKKVYTYDDDLISEEQVYDDIKDVEPFTIKGYTVTITYNDESSSIIKEKGKDKMEIYTLDKDIVKEALYDIAATFIGEDKLEAYESQTQTEIIDEGEKLTSVYYAESITIKEDYISTEETIFEDLESLKMYMLFGTTEKQKTVYVQDNEDLQTIADNNSLNIQELLVANPTISSDDLLMNGQELNVGLIDPVVSVTYKKQVVEVVDIQPSTTYVDDSSKYTSYSEVTTQGVAGKTKVTQDILYVNGEINQLQITNKEVITPVVDEVITRGTKVASSYSYVYTNSGNESWSWPTITPYIITSRFAYRWGSLHKGIDISGCGYGSPIVAVQGGVVYDTGYHSSMGYYVVINHGNGYYTQYMHLAKYIVKTGQTVSKEEKIGTMGSTGNSTGTHLHLGVWYGGPPYEGGTVLDPCKTIFSC